MRRETRSGSPTGCPELIAFPNGWNDDEIDATSKVLAYLVRKTTTAYAERRPRP